MRNGVFFDMGLFINDVMLKASEISTVVRLSKPSTIFQANPYNQKLRRVGQGVLKICPQIIIHWQKKNQVSFKDLRGKNRKRCWGK